ncbi:Holliday junction resolvase RuvX [bacterium]|jgi:putative Holliday junction resolvase|nr:Holliday junction resolvase RuvX [bacterium]
MRLMALDVGKRRIGIAISDPMQVTARPHSTIARTKTSPAEIAKLAGELETGTILVGLPLHLNGTEGEQAKDARSFAAKLAQSASGIQIEFVDERLTTVEAEERLADRRGSWRKKKDRIDAFAAASILQNYLNSR